MLRGRWLPGKFLGRDLSVTHIGEVVEEVVPDLQRRSFFLRFTGYLRNQCSTGPEVTGRIASPPRLPSRHRGEFESSDQNRTFRPVPRQEYS
jgi:hypothetical protein